jgi:phosphatidylglycerophosphate synthase
VRATPVRSARRPLFILGPVREQTTLQRIASQTHGVVTPSNALDVVAMAGVAWAAPRIDTWPGYVIGASSYFADVADGIIARRTGTTSMVGEIMDHVVGDKPKLFFGFYYVWRLELADRSLLAAVAGYNVANALVTGYDWLSNTEPQVQVTRGGKRAMFSTAAGVGIHVLGSNLSRTHPGAGRALKWFGRLFSWTGLVVYGIPTTREYWHAARQGPKRRPART